MPNLKSKPKILPKELQKIVLEYADLDLSEKYSEFYNYNESRRVLNITNNAQIVFFRPAQTLIGKVFASTSEQTPGKNLFIATAGFTAASLSVFVTAPFACMAAIGTGIKDLSMFVRRKAKEKSVKEVFDTDLLEEFTQSKKQNQLK